MTRIHRSLLMYGFLLLMCAAQLSATDPRSRVSQLGHTAWRVRDGILGSPSNTIAQSADGYLWFGTESGLLRFDGTSFDPWTPPHWDEVGLGGVQILHAGSDGTLWIGTLFGLVSWKNGQISTVEASRHLGRVMQIAEDPQHRIWFSVDHGADKILCRLDGDDVHCYGKADGIPLLHGENFTISREGVFTLSSRDTVIDWTPERGLLSKFSFDKLPQVSSYGVVALDRSADGATLVGIEFPGKGLGLQQLKNGVVSPLSIAGFDSRTIAVQNLFTDRAGTLWIGTVADGLYKVVGQSVDHFTQKDGLSGNSVRWFHEDHEGNLWVATDAGIDCFHDQKAVSWTTQEGLSGGRVTSVVATRDGAVLVAVDSSVNLIRNGQVTLLPKPAWAANGPVLALMEDRAGRYWMNLSGELVVYDGKQYKLLKRPAGDPVGRISSLMESADGSVWARVLSRPAMLAHVVNDKVVEMVSDPKISYALAADRQSGMWVNRGHGIGHYADGRMQTFEFAADPKREHLMVENSLVADEDGAMYKSSSLGLWGLKDGRSQRLGAENGLPCEVATGLVFSQAHSLFIHMPCGLVEVTAEELRAWWSNPRKRVHYKWFDTLDGIDISDSTYFPLMSLAPDGRIWIGNDSAVQVVDPNHLPMNSVPPPVHIQQVVADRVILNRKENLELPALTRDLEIHYVGLSFSIPQKVRFRYMLEGRDTTWQEPWTRRTALYQDLKPGHYRFHVIASNNDGVWNDVGDTLEFSVRAAWFQTTWFRTLSLTAACLLIWALYLLRVRSIAKAMSARFDERLDERTRMALELHDTFLQTVQGSKMVADDALDATSDQARMRLALEKLSLWLAQAVSEGRAALHALRVSTTERNHLAEFLGRTAREQCHGTSISVALTVIGDAIELHPIVRDEIARIAEEAIRNSCLHSRASQLSVELRYARDLNLNIKDNGIGIDPEVVGAGRSGHFGLQGMRERSARIRAKLTVASSRNTGTQISLNVPGDVAYQRTKRDFADRLRDLRFWRHPSAEKDAKDRDFSDT